MEKRCSKKFHKIHRKTPVLSIVSLPEASATLIKKRLRCFPVNFVEFLRTPFLTEHLRWLLLHIILRSSLKLTFQCKNNVTMKEVLQEIKFFRRQFEIKPNRWLTSTSLAITWILPGSLLVLVISNCYCQHPILVPSNLHPMKQIFKLWLGQKQPPGAFYKKGVLKNFVQFTGKQSLFFNKEKCFSVNLAKFLRTPFLRTTSGRLFLTRISDTDKIYIYRFLANYPILYLLYLILKTFGFPVFSGGIK